MLLPWTASAAPAIAAAAAAAPAAPAPAAAPERNPAFYAAHPYATPADILPFIQQQAAPGDAQAVLDAMDTFSQYYPQYKIGPEKGALLEGLLLDGPAPPTRVLEVGTFLGYSAIRIARHLGRQPGARLVCIEANTQNAAVAREVLRHAGVADRVLVLDGLSSQVIPQLPQLLLLQDELQGQGQQAQQQRQQPPQQQGFDVVFLDHCKECYLPDLQLLERLQLVRPGTRVVADNVVYPGAPGFLEYLDSSGHYVTRLLDAAYEYEQPWNPSWEAHKRDALSVSLCQAGPQAAAAAAAGDAVLQLGT